jgi:hypothetical protein
MPAPPRQGNRRPDVTSVAPREVLARLLRGVAKPQVKPLIGVSDPYRHGVLSVEPASCVPARGALWQARAG